MDELLKLRDKIDSVDENILELLSERMELVKKVGEYKKKNNKTIVDKKRESEKIDRLEAEGKKYGINRTMIEKIWKTLFEIAYIQEK